MIDHLVLATDDLERTVATISDRWSVTPTPGGAHVGRGTRNELVAIGDGAYLEIIGPDLAQRDHAGERPFGVGDRSGGHLVAWCSRVDGNADLETVAAAARQLGHALGPITSMSRRRPDGVLLEWRLTVPPALGPRPDADPEPVVLPFLIDWLRSEHPTASLQHPVELIDLELHTPQPDVARAVIEAIGGDRRLSVHDCGSDRPRLVAYLRTPAGQVTLSG